MKYLLTKCGACQRELKTAYKNAHCIPEKPKPSPCRFCDDRNPPTPAVYYKHCDFCGPASIVYRVETSFDSRGRLSDKKIFKLKCGGDHVRGSSRS